VAETDYRLFLCMEGYPRSVLVVNPVTLAVEDTVHLPSTPHGIDFSPDYDKWFVSLSWDLLEIDPGTTAIARQVAAQSPWVKVTANDMLVTYRRNVIEFWSLDNLSILHSDSLYVLQMVQDPNNTETLYGTYRITDEKPTRFGGIFEYDTESFAIRRTFEVDRVGPQDLEISKDGKYLFLTGVGPGWYGEFFYVIDVERGEVVEQHPISNYAQMELSPDGRYVYITDPGGYMRTWIYPEGIVRRYDIETQSMEDFLLLLDHIDPDYGFPPMADRMVILPDNRTAFISSWYSGHGVMKWDLERRTLLDRTGFDATQGQLVREMVLGKRF
jgi:hypothetical protein